MIQMMQTVGGLIIQCRHILVVRAGDKWVFPGGHVENDEYDDECLEREIKEELSGLSFTSMRYFGSFHGWSQSRNLPLTMQAYFIRPKDHVFIPSGEITQAALIAGKDTKRYNLALMTKSCIEALRYKGFL